MNNNKIAQIKKSADTTAKVVNVFAILMRVVAVLTFVAAIFIFCFSKQLDGFVSATDGHWELATGGTTQIISRQGASFIETFNFMNFSTWAACNALYGSVIAVAISIAMSILRKTFIAVKESETPFNEDVLKKMRATGIITSVLVILSSVGIGVCVALSFWCLYSIFSYGIELQKNEDETL
ncbi:MAG: hypothetical protein J6X48_05170 [Lachnospiraceae bacterium]|nr:hypothetical protein [Lachnospiraceae bacterium]